MNKNDFDPHFFEWAAFLGILISFGQLLDSTQKLTLRLIVGRAIVSAGLAATAPAFLLWFPEMPRSAQFALAAVFASVGTSGLQAVLRRFISGSWK